MSQKQKTNLIKCLATIVFGLVLSGYYVFSRDFAAQPLVEKYRTLCDGFFLPGIFMVMFGLLFTMNNVGALDSISYLLKYAVRTFVPGAFTDMPHYLDYVEERRGKRIKGYKFLFLVGGGFLLVSVVFLVLFYRLY